MSSASYSAKRSTFILFVNGRCVESGGLRRALEATYAAVLPKVRHGQPAGFSAWKRGVCVGGLGAGVAGVSCRRRTRRCCPRQVRGAQARMDPSARTMCAAPISCAIEGAADSLDTPFPLLQASRPFLFLDLRLPPRHVEVNMHPTKREVGGRPVTKVLPPVQAWMERSAPPGPALAVHARQTRKLQYTIYTHAGGPAERRGRDGAHPGGGGAAAAGVQHHPHLHAGMARFGASLQCCSAAACSAAVHSYHGQPVTAGLGKASGMCHEAVGSPCPCPLLLYALMHCLLCPVGRTSLCAPAPDIARYALMLCHLSCCAQLPVSKSTWPACYAHT